MHHYFCFQKHSVERKEVQAPLLCQNSSSSYIMDEFEYLPTTADSEEVAEDKMVVVGTGKP